MKFRLTAVAAFFVLGVLPAQAQQSVTLRFQNGLVTLRAQNAPVRTILAEWARLGGATIVNGDRVTGPPVTLELADVPERQALDIVLRNVAGYMLGPRPAGSTGASAFDRILILPTSVAPRTPPPAAPAVAAARNPRPVLPRPTLVPRPPQGLPPGVDDSDAGDDQLADDDGQPNQPAAVPPRPLRPPFRLPQPPGADVPDGDDDADDPADAPAPAVTPSPANPFAPFGTSATPGAIVPVPRQQTPANRVQ